tara:strand:- start:512 stop:625 length:114 start_codon:yes stop_codon:yes gene_type:complete
MSEDALPFGTHKLGITAPIVAAAVDDITLRRVNIGTR